MFNEYRVSVLQDVKRSVIGWLCCLHNNVNALNALELYT